MEEKEKTLDEQIDLEFRLIVSCAREGKRTEQIQHYYKYEELQRKKYGDKLDSRGG